MINRYSDELSGKKYEIYLTFQNFDAPKKCCRYR